MDKTQDLIDLIPDVIQPGGDTITSWEIKPRLAKLERQEVVLHVASWLHMNETLLPHIDFELSVSDDRVFLEEDDVGVGAEITDKDHVLGELEDLVSELDSMLNEDTQSLVKRVIRDLNRAKWKMIPSWEALADAAPLPSGISGVDWLGAHRAAWFADDLQKITDVATASSCKRRI